MPETLVADSEVGLLMLHTFPADTGEEVELKYPIEDNSLTPFNEETTPFDLEDPGNISKEMEYDTESGNYYYRQKLGDDLDYRPDNYMTLDEYLDYDLDESIDKYWQSKVATENEFNKENGFQVPPIKVENKAFDRIFGGNTIDIRPSGSAELVFGLNISRTDNPSLPERQRRITIFDFDQRIQLNVIGNIGDKLRITTNYNTEATFDFENQVKVEYTGYEDEIIQKIEAGNVTLPLNSSLITGSQSLFGVKTKLRFGRLTVTSVASMQRGQRSEIDVQGGAQITEFELGIDQYEEDKHYFLNHFFRDNYEQATANPPFVNTGINITKLEVWVSNTNNNPQNNRSVIAFQDLGEANPNRLYNSNGRGQITITSTTGAADNEANSLYNTIRNDQQVRGFLNANAVLDGRGLIPRLDYIKVGNARKLDQTEYTFHPQLGFVSLNQQQQPNQVLGIAVQYTYRGRTYQVGEFSTDVQNGQALYLKMLKSSELVTTIPMWDLMMKNVYSLSAYQVQQEDFRLDIWYLDRERGVEVNFLSEGPPDVNGKPLIQVVGLDKLDINNNPRKDGVFDFLTFSAQNVPTINPQNGRIYFPTLEPFGRTLREELGSQQLGDQYAFDSLYTNTQIYAQTTFPEQNRFTIKGQYQSSASNEISLNALNVPEGSVQVTAGGRQLQENVDYTVDYTLGRVKIINQGLLESGTPIKISLESNAFFNIQQRTLLGTRFDYQVNEDFVLGGTIMNLTERPLTQKINVGEEPMSNTIWGVDGTYRTESPFLTRMVDKIPFIDTKETSTVQVQGEFAQLIPGHNRAIGQEGNAYIDDFEGSQSVIDLRAVQMWSLASIPQRQTSLFPEAELTNNLGSGFNRARVSWYNIDPLFWRNNNITPDHIKNDPGMQSNHFMREVPQQEVFPNRENANFQQQNIPTFDFAFYPSEKGPYNYDVDGFTEVDGGNVQVGYGIDQDGALLQPQNRWGGIQRDIVQQDFQDANVEYIQFWVMDPFNEDYTGTFGDGQFNGDDGRLFFNLGTVSEDIQKDGQIIYENLLPADAEPITDSPISEFGRFTPGVQYVNGFDNDPNSRQFQDVGLDGLRNEEEQSFFTDYVSDVQAAVGPNAPQTLISDPSSDDFRYYNDGFYDGLSADILTRYKLFNGLDGNSPIAGQSGDAAIGSTRPNSEDINRDNNLDEAESYWQYSVDISPEDLNPGNVGSNYIADVTRATVNTPDGRQRDVDWYLIRIPVNDGIPIGNIRDFRSIRFMRMFARGFERPLVLRFARLEFVRGEWRRYEGSLEAPGDFIVRDESTDFVVQAVNIEENSQKIPVNYVIPPGIEREINVGTTNLAQMNEQSLSLQVCDLPDGDARAAFRNVDLDVLNYKTIKLFVHGESADANNPVEDDELTVFVRLGADFTDNYYEYEIPLKITEPGRYSNASDDSRRIVWPTANNMEIRFGDLTAAKTSRNRASISNPDQVTNRTRYAYPVGNATVYVVGNPNLATLKTIMLGVRNPKRGTLPEDDGLPKCAEVWFNELRLSGFDQQTGWAAIARVTSQLADFATVSVSGAMSTPGWGGLEDKVSERQRETIQQFDISANVELGKFFGEKSGIKIPMYVGYSEFVSKPQFAPLAPDIKFDDYITESFPNKEQQDSVRRIQETREIRRSINFTNVRKEKTNSKKKTRFYDISNFSTTYSYSEDFRRDFDTEYDMTKTYRGGVNYNFNSSPKNFTPFSNLKPFRKSKYARPIRDFNFYLLPKQFTFSTDIDRTYNETKIRNINPGITADIQPLYVKSFNWNRNYGLRWDLTRSLKVEFQANNQALIEEPDGPVNRKFYPEEYDNWRDSVWSNIGDFGTNMRYNHSVGVTYALPFNKLPATDWISSNVRYTGTYDWQRAPFAADSLGNTIQNSQQIQVNGTFNFLTLYNKVKFLRKVNQKANQRGRGGSRQRRGESARELASDTTKTKKKKRNEREGLGVLGHTAKVLMMIKSASVSYAQNRGILLPGYSPTHELLGMNPEFTAPGVGFIVGQQGNFGDGMNFLDYAQDRDWLVQEEAFNGQYVETYSEQVNIRVNIEPARDLRIELTANWDESRNYSVYNRWYDTLSLEDEPTRFNTFFKESPITTGNFSISFLSISTALTRDNEDNVNQAFENFSDYRETYSRRLASENESSQGLYQGDSIVATGTYYDGYGPQQPDVMLLSFISAYSGRNPDQASLNAFQKLPMPNWRVTYTGLTKIDFLKKYFKTVTLSHGYRSTLTISNFRTNILYEDPNGDGYSDVRDPINDNDFISRYEYQTVNIRESFSPLVNIDMTWNNSLITKFEVRRDRSMALSMANAQVTETRSMEYIVGLGYTFDKVPLPFTLKSKRNKIQSDLRTRADFSIRNNFTMLRKLDTDIRPNEPTGGQRILSLKLTADYSLSNRLNIRLFFDRILTTPVISTAFPTANTSAGVSVRFTLSG